MFIRQMEGEGKVYHYLKENQKWISESKTPYLFIDALNCGEGCLYGTGVEEDKTKKDDALCSIMKIKADSPKIKKDCAWSKKLSPEQRFNKLNKQFRSLNLSDYLRSYTDRSSACGYRKPSEEEKQRIFTEMNKLTPMEQKINCSCCGYETCSEMATAIYNEYNHKENCIYYMKREVELQKEQAELMTVEVENKRKDEVKQKELIMSTVEQINNEFVILHKSVDDLMVGNDSNAQESTKISEDIQM